MIDINNSHISSVQVKLEGLLEALPHHPAGSPRKYHIQTYDAY
jgi:hypothetical protein